jgi:hypothetical protein
MIFQVSQQTRKITDRVSVICPHNRKGLTFVGQGAVMMRMLPANSMPANSKTWLSK